MATALDQEALSKVSGNARVAVDFWTAVKERRFDDAVALLDLDGTYWVGWVPPRTEMTLRVFKWELGLLSKAPPRESGAPETHHFSDVFNGDDDRVVLEMFIKGPLPDGRNQDNVYCFLMRIKDGKIYDLREYADTWWAYELNAGQIDMWKRLHELAPYGTSAERFAEIEPLLLPTPG
jgi:ketosteroid isomerase-like protein